MLDGNTINTLTDTPSSQAFNVCKVTPKDLNVAQRNKEAERAMKTPNMIFAARNIYCIKHLNGN